MNLKLIVVCATLAVVSCGRVDSEELNRQIQQQQEMVEQQNDQIREHHRLENQQRRDQQRDLEDQRRRQDEMIREQEQHSRENVQLIGNHFIAAQPRFIQAPIHFISVPSSSRNFEYLDDSNYNFAYAVRDLTTGDMKSQNEVRRGDQVQGHYTMMDSDGYQRTVEYRADDKNGFEAEVRREPVSPQLVRIDESNNYANHFFNPIKHVARYIVQPTIYSTASVSRHHDGQRNQYVSTTASNF